MSGQSGKPACELVADTNHLAPDFFHPFHVGLVLLKQHDHPVDLLQFGLKLRDLAVQRLVLACVSEVVVKFFHGCLFERVEINEFRCHVAKVRAAQRPVNFCAQSKTTRY